MTTTFWLLDVEYNSPIGIDGKKTHKDCDTLDEVVKKLNGFGKIDEDYWLLYAGEVFVTSTDDRNDFKEECVTKTDMVRSLLISTQKGG